MLLLTDTCFWSHAEELNRNDVWDIRTILFSFRICTTGAVKAEILHFHLEDFVPLDRIFLVPVSRQDFRTYSGLLPDLGPADQSLIIASRKNVQENPIILTDDGELLTELIQTKLAGMGLPVFLLQLIRIGLVKKNIGAKCLRFWEKVGRYKKSDLAKWKKELQSIT